MNFQVQFFGLQDVSGFWNSSSFNIVNGGPSPKLTVVIVTTYGTTTFPGGQYYTDLDFQSTSTFDASTSQGLTSTDISSTASETSNFASDTPTSNKSDDNVNRLSVGAGIGIGIGVTVSVILVIVLGWWLIQQSRYSRRDGARTDPAAETLELQLEDSTGMKSRLKNPEDKTGGEIPGGRITTAFESHNLEGG